MAHYRTYDCDVCQGRFRWLHHPSDSPAPETCQLCGAPSGGEPVFSPEAPGIKGVRIAAAEQVYRSMESGSAERAEMARDIAGGDAADYSHMKITDLNTQQREGDISYKMPTPSNNEVQGFMTNNPQAAVGNQHAAVAQSYAAQAHQGYFPHAGSRTQSVVSNLHQTMRANMEQRGRLNK